MAQLLFYLGLALLLTLEEAGVFLLPGDISMVAAGVYAAQGGPFIGVSWVVSTIGMVAGSCVLFHMVRRNKTSTRVLPARVRQLVHRHGALGVAGARCVPGLRNATVFAAGAASLPTDRFLLGLVPAAAVWSGLLLLLGWFGGDAILTLYGRLEGLPILKILSVGLVVVAAVIFFIRARSTARDSVEL